MDTGPMDVDRLWRVFKTLCNKLKTAVTLKERNASVAEAEAFMADPTRRARVHKWRAWGLLFSGLINVVRDDICAYMGIDPRTGATAVARGKKRKLKSSASTKSTLPKFRWWLNLRNEFANSHVLDGPMLHLDPNGRDCVAQLFDFALLVINRGGSSEPDSSVRHVMGEIERAAWQTIELIVGYRVYCAVLEKKQLQEAIEFALAAVDHAAVPHSSFPSIGSSDFALLVSCIHVVLQHAPYDLLDWLPMLVPYLSSWFRTLNETTMTARSPHADLAPKMMEIVTDLGRAFFTSIGPLLLQHGSPMLQYIKRSFKGARQRARVQLAEFVSLYVEMFEYHADSLTLEGDLKPSRLLRDAKALQSIFLDLAMLQSVPVSSHVSSTIGPSSAAIGGSNEAPTVSLEPASVALFACAADVVYFHDRLLQQVVETSKSQNLASNDQDRDQGEDLDMMTTPSPAKRSLDATMPMAWEQLLHQLPSADQSEEPSSANADAPLTQMREQLVQQALHQKQARLLQRRHVAHLLVLTALLRRHGSFYADGRIGDLVGIMDHIIQTLESKEVGKRQYLALHLLYQLAMLSPNHPDLRDELFVEYWWKVWSTLLRPDFPYASELHVVVPRNGLSELVFTALHCCVCFRLVSLTEILRASSQLWAIYRPGSSVSPGCTLSSPISAAPIGLLASLVQLMHPSSDNESRQAEAAPHLAPLGCSVRSEVLSSVFEHIQSTVLLEESKPTDSSWENHFSANGAISAVYAAALLSFLGLSPPARHVSLFLCSEMEPGLLRALSTSTLHKTENVVGPELDGFGVHFVLQEWGLAWLQSTSSFVKNGSQGHPDRFTTLLEFLQQSQENCGRTTDTRVDREKASGFDCFQIPDRLARRTTGDRPREPASIVSILACMAGHDGEMSATTSFSSVDASKTDITTRFTQIVDDLSSKLSAAEPDSPRLLCHLNSLMTVALTLATAYGQAKDISFLDSKQEHKDIIGLLCALLHKCLKVLASHLSAGTIDHARKSTMTASILTQQLMDFQSFILIVQGSTSLNLMSHPCADPVDLRIPSELRPSIRKIVAAIEASLELMIVDSGDHNGALNAHSNHHSATPSREDDMLSSRSFSPATVNSTPIDGVSWDWDSHLSQPRAARSIFCAAVEAEADDLLSDLVTVTSTSKPTYRATHAPKILSLWSLRVILLLKKESGLKAVRKYTLELGFTPDFLIAVASLLCGVCGHESLEVLVKIMDSVDKDVAGGIRRGGASGNPAAALILDSDILRVLKRCAMVYESRKHLHKEDVPELLLTTTRRLIDTGRQVAAKDQLFVLRQTVVATMEVFFRLDADVFYDFIDVAMASLLDPVMVVRFESVRSLQTLFYMYPDGGDQVFRDLFEFLSQCLPPSASSQKVGVNQKIGSEDQGRSSTIESCIVALATLYVCACSSPTVVPEALLVVMRLATANDVVFYTRSSMLKEWLGEIAGWYGYPSVGRMVADHFCFLWSNHIMAFAGCGSLLENKEQRKRTGHTPQVDAKELLEAFPAALMLDKTEAWLTATANATGIFASHVDVILPLAVVYDVVNGEDANDPGFSLVQALARHLLLDSFSPATSDDEMSMQHHLSSFVQEQLITDLFALAFVLESASSSAPDRARVERLGATMLTLAEERASTYALTLSHLGHVVVKMVRFSVWDVVGSIDPLAVEKSAIFCGAERWLRAMQIMKEKYSGFDWGRMNLAELLSEFHELLLRTANFEPLASRAVECMCLFVDEIKDAISDSNAADDNSVLQHLLLHVLFETTKNVKRRDKQSSRKLAFTVRDICDHFMKNCTEAFGKYLNYVVQEITDILVRSSRATDAVSLDSDDKANFEWVIFAICNNMATGLGKFMVDVEVVPSGVSPCLDKLNSMLSTSPGKSSQESSVERRKSLENTGNKRTVPRAITDKACQHAIHEIEKFVQRANQVGERFYQPRTFALGNWTTIEPSGIECQDAAEIGSQLHVLGDHIRVLQESLRASTHEQVTDEDKTEAAATQKAVLAKLTRTLFTLSTQYNCGSALLARGARSDVLLTLADTLGKVGMWETSDFELSPGQNGEELSRLYQRHFRRGALRETKTTFQVEMYEHILRYLSSLMFESGGDTHLSSEAIHEALNSIKKVLRLDEGVKALTKSKDQELKLFLEAFVHTSPSDWSLSWSTVAGVAYHPTLANLSELRVLWRAHDTTSFEKWIGPLAEAMGGRCPDRVLQACAPLARLRTDLAIFMFPYVLWAVMKNARSDPKTAAVVNDCIREIMSVGGKAIPNGRVVQLIIHSINFLRETEKALFVETNGQKVGGTTTTPTKKGPSSVTLTPTHPRQITCSSKRARSTGDSSSLNRLAYSCLVDVHLLDLAEAAIRVKMPFSAMQYVEMWLEDHHGGSLPSLSASGVTVTAPVEWDVRVRGILVDAYNLDDDADGIYGVNDGRTLASQMVAYNREGNFAQVLPLYDVALQFDQSASNIRVLEGSLDALNHLGYEHMLLQRLDALAGRGSNTPNIQEHRFKLAWKSLQWDSLDAGASHVALSGVTRPDGNQSPYMHQRTIFQSLKTLAHRDIGQLKQMTALAKQHILASARMSLFGLECTQESLEALLHLQSISKIEECAKVVESANTAALTQLFVTWLKRDSTQSKKSFDATHGLLALEEVLAQLVDLPERASTLASIYLSVSTLSRQAGRVAVAYKAYTKLEQLCKSGQLRLLDEAKWKMERAKLLWSQRETRSAIWIAKQLQSDLEVELERRREDTDTRLKMFYVASLTMTGKWIASQRSENSQVILREYLQKATDIVDAMSGNELHMTPSDTQHAARAHIALAEYMAEMYQQVAARVSSREWLAGKRVAEARQRELAECLAMSEVKQHDNRAHIHALNKEVQYDYDERTKVEASVDQFLGGALRSFGKALVMSANAELAVVFRVLSLWFGNQLKPSVNLVVQEIVDSVPSYKFVPLSYQIISRVGSSLSVDTSTATRTDESGALLFERVLSAIVLKLCEQHPHHALVQLIALKNSGDVEGRGSIEFRTNVGDAKSDGAKKYIAKLRTGPQSGLLESLDMLSHAYVQLALFDTREYHKSGKKIPLADIKITPLGGGHAIPFDHCLRDRSRRSGASSSSRSAMPAVLTSAIAPRPDMDYSGVSRVLSFDPMFSITDSGIHRPKIIYCFGSDGRRFKQLVKGKDDIRQDLVIEQVFDTVNQFLHADPHTRTRHLRLRTYKVVPLSPIAGVLEWVDRTIPWGSYLVSRVAKRLSAHERYHPHEWKHTECRLHLKNQPDKFAAYETIQANFTPVFHHFFLEKFPDAAMWYKRRLAYVQSAAVTSIVGYILGIGDRHSQNILIHEDTGELVHIDFGVVFDQGMALFTPETVPFRLTREVVDGMGVAGVDGVFTRCCEATLQLLRTQRASVVTILEVFVHDPLYRWTLSPLKALKIQEEGATAATTGASRSNGGSEQEDSAVGVGGATNATDAAARALLRVKQKLEGYEDPHGNALSIEGQVKQLISAAQDPRNLCKLFPGWAPWL